MSVKSDDRALAAATAALKALGNEDLLYCHYGTVRVREETYKRLAGFFQEFAKAEAKL